MVVGGNSATPPAGRKRVSGRSEQNPEKEDSLRGDSEPAEAPLGKPPEPSDEPSTSPDEASEASEEPPKPSDEVSEVSNEPSEKVGQKPAPRRVVNKLINHPLWTSLGAITGVIGIVVSIVQLSDSSDSRYTPAELEVPMMAVDSPEEIDGTVTYPDNGIRPITVTSSPVDITLKNNGDKPALITKADAEVVFFSPLQDCTPGGARPGYVSADYSINLPTLDDAGSVALGAYSTSMRFEVKPASVDRMRLTIGPKRQTYAGNNPLVMAVRLTLIHHGSDDLEVGTVAMAITGEKVQSQIEDANNPECAKRNLEILDNLYAIQAYRAPDLDRMRKKYQQLSRE